MKDYSEKQIHELCEHLDIQSELFIECLEESVIEIHESNDHLDLDGGSVLHLRRLQRICQTLNVEPPVAVLLHHLLQRIAELEKRLPRGPDA